MELTSDLIGVVSGRNGHIFFPLFVYGSAPYGKRGYSYLLLISLLVIPPPPTMRSLQPSFVALLRF